MKIFNLALISVFSGLLSLSVIAETRSFFSLDAVVVFSQPGQTQDVNLWNNIGNTYSANRSWQNNVRAMLGVGVQAYASNEWQITSGLRFLPTINMSGQGDVLQLKSDNFLNFSYSYDITSHLLLWENSVTWTKHRWQPGLLVGIGGAWNTLSNYREIPLNEYAYGGQDHFSSQSQSQFLYEVGAVLDYAVDKNVMIEGAYRYIDAGNARLGVSPGQNTHDHLSTGPLHYQTISLGVRIYDAL